MIQSTGGIHYTHPTTQHTPLMKSFPSYLSKNYTVCFSTIILGTYYKDAGLKIIQEGYLTYWMKERFLEGI